MISAANRSSNPLLAYKIYRSVFFPQPKLITLLLVIVTIISSSVQAQNSESPAPLSFPLKIRIREDFLPRKGNNAIGIVLNGDNVTQIKDLKIQRSGPTEATVEIPWDPSETNDTTKVTALLIAENLEIIFGDLTPLTVSAHQVATVQQCLVASPSDLPLDTQVGALESLVKVRRARRDLAMVQLSRILTPELLTKIKQKEQLFGLASEQLEPISVSMNPAEIYTRLFRLAEPVRTFKQRKEVEEKKLAAK